jgi:hypothetical protein
MESGAAVAASAALLPRKTFGGHPDALTIIRGDALLDT